MVRHLGTSAMQRQSHIIGLLAYNPSNPAGRLTLPMGWSRSLNFAPALGEADYIECQSHERGRST